MRQTLIIPVANEETSLSHHFMDLKMSMCKSNRQFAGKLSRWFYVASMPREKALILHFLERCPSGLRCTLGKRVCPKGTGGSNPPLSVIRFASKLSSSRSRMGAIHGNHSVL